MTDKPEHKHKCKRCADIFDCVNPDCTEDIGGHVDGCLACSGGPAKRNGNNVGDVKVEDFAEYRSTFRDDGNPYD